MNINVKFFGDKENIVHFFTGVRGFWLSMGIVFLALLILFFVFIFPPMTQCKQEFKNLQDVSAILETYALKKDLYNDAWISSKNSEAELSGKELEKCMAFLKKKDDYLEAIFSREDTEGRVIAIEDEALWKNEYLRRISELITRLKSHNIDLSEDSLPFQEWGSYIPTWAEILPVQKKFWILDSLANVLVRDVGAIKLEGVIFRETSHTYTVSLAEVYTAIPLTLKMELQADHILVLLQNLLTSEVPFVIENISILSTNKTYFAASPDEHADASEESKHSLNPVIDVGIDLYVIDVKTS
jgi:hypothetical protein